MFVIHFKTLTKIEFRICLNQYYYLKNIFSQILNSFIYLCISIGTYHILTY